MALLDARVTSALPFTQQRFLPNCLQSVIGGNPVVVAEQIDINVNGKLDEVVLYRDDWLHLVAALDLGTQRCQIVLNDTITGVNLIDGWQTVQVERLEL